MIADCVKALRDAPAIPKTRLQWRKADLAIGKAGIEATEPEGAATVVLDEADIELPDLLTDLQDRTPLGGYNPDWAVLVEQEGEERLYFVVETKGTMLFADASREDRHVALESTCVRPAPMPAGLAQDAVNF